MKRVCIRIINVSDLFEYIGSEYSGEMFNITHPSDMLNITPNSIVYIPSIKLGMLKNIPDDVLFISDTQVEGKTTLVCKEPEVAFYRIINEFFMDQIASNIDITAAIDKNAKLGNNVTVCRNADIGSNVQIGNNCYIGRNAVIDGNVIIGNNCIIRDNTIIGSGPYDFIIYEERYLHKPGFGNIIIGNNVLIGTGTTIEQPRFYTTYIKDDVKIDDTVNIGSACILEEKVRISAGCVLCSDVEIGKNTALGINVSIKNEIRIANDIIIGMGSVVIHNLDLPGTYVGNPTKQINGGVQ